MPDISGREAIAYEINASYDKPEPTPRIPDLPLAKDLQGVLDPRDIRLICSIPELINSGTDRYAFDTKAQLDLARVEEVEQKYKQTTSYVEKVKLLRKAGTLTNIVNNLRFGSEEAVRTTRSFLSKARELLEKSPDNYLEGLYEELEINSIMSRLEGTGLLESIRTVEARFAREYPQYIDHGELTETQLSDYQFFWERNQRRHRFDPHVKRSTSGFEDSLQDIAELYDKNRSTLIDEKATSAMLDKLAVESTSEILYGAVRYLYSGSLSERVPYGHLSDGIKFAEFAKGNEEELFAEIRETYHEEVADEDEEDELERKFHDLRLTAEGVYKYSEIIEHPWLRYAALVDAKAKFPTGGSIAEKEKWFTANAQHIPEGWNTRSLTRLVINRLDQGVDRNLHDATYWLKAFERPEEWKGNSLADDKLERNLLVYLKGLRADELARLNLPKKEKVVQEIFADPANADMYKYFFGIDGEYDRDVAARSLFELQVPSNYESATFRPSIAVQILKRLGSLRQEYVQEVQKWVQTNGMTPGKVLETAWRNREAALAAGYTDNPGDIMRYVAKASLQIEYKSMKESSSLPENITEEVFNREQDFLQELARCYGGRTAIQELSWYLENGSTDSVFAPFKTTLDDGWEMEILAKDDPRGYTIGYDTGCCMTVGGDSEDCIRAGYSDPRYGFILFKDPLGRVAAQSLIYVNPPNDQRVMVLDNIEFNQGRDVGKLLDRYQQALKRYFAHQAGIDDKWRINTVHLGEGYTDVNFSHLDKVGSIPTPLAGTYTDAEKQRLLIKPGKSDLIVEVERKELSIRSEELTRENIDTAVDLERQIYPAEIQSGREFFVDELAEGAGRFSRIFFDPDSGKPVGYLVASRAASERDDKKVVYVSDLAFLPEVQKQGLGTQILEELLQQASEDGLTRIEMHARESTSYPAIMQRMDLLKALGYRVAFDDRIDGYYGTESAHHLRIEKV